MKILAYNDVDPFEVLQLNLLERGVVFTPETALALRRSEPRIFPWLTLNAVERGVITGQIGAFRQPMASMRGNVEVGSVWGFVVRGGLKARGPGAVLLEELHGRMRSAGLSFAVAFAKHQSSAYRLFVRMGYRELHWPGYAFARWGTAYQPTRLSAGLAGPGGYELVERLFSEIAGACLGFSRRPIPFPPLRAADQRHIWVFRQAGEMVGYGLAQPDQSVLNVGQMVLKPGVNAAEAVSALAANLRVNFVQVEVNRPGEMDDLGRAGYRLVRPAGGVLMIRPLFPSQQVEDLGGLFAAGTDRFLFSLLDVLEP